MTTWPSTLPDFAWMRVSGSFGEGRRVTPTDSGFQQLSVLTADPFEPLSISFEVTGTQLDALRTFYKTTLANGVLPFDHTDPIGGSTISWRFAAAAPPPQWQRIPSGKDGQGFTGRFFSVSFSLERLP